MSQGLDFNEEESCYGVDKAVRGNSESKAIGGQEIRARKELPIGPGAIEYSR